jgi:lysophospholipase L1-like esterase
MVALAQQNGVEVVLCSVLPTEPSNYADRPPERIVALNDWLRATAARMHLRYVNYYAAFIGRTGLTVDGIHPNASGYKQMHDAIAKALRIQG